jgi:hypothetical protein
MDDAAGTRVCFPNQSEEASQNKTEEEEEEMERCKRSQTTLYSEGGVEEFLVLFGQNRRNEERLKKKAHGFQWY